MDCGLTVECKISLTETKDMSLSGSVASIEDTAAYFLCADNTDDLTVGEAIKGLLQLIYKGSDFNLIELNVALPNLAMLYQKDKLWIAMQFYNKLHQPEFFLLLAKENALLKLQFQMMSPILFSNLPLVGGMFSKEDGIHNLNLCFVSDDSDMDFQINYELILLKSPIRIPDNELKKLPSTSDELKRNAEVKENSHSISKKIGIFELEHIKAGYKLESNQVYIAIDAAVDFSIIKFQMKGLQVGLPIERLLNPEIDNLKELSFSLQGLVVDFNKAGLTISGGLLRDYSQSNVTCYNGMLEVGYGKLQLTAIANYQQIANQKDSFCAFVIADYPLGGCPAFYVTGLSAGMAVNYALRMPELSEVEKYPLITMLEKPNPNKTAMDLLADLNTYLTAEAGQYFIGLGVKFTTFEMIETKAVAVLQFGNSLQIDMIGKSTLSIPAKASSPMVYAVLAMSASISPKEGTFLFRGNLTNESYLFHKDCKLAGGFALATWFGENAHAGDFVFSIGGYASNFNKPEYYPSVDRVAVNWNITNELALKGEAYFALVPTGIMTGGALSMIYQSGNLSAWFTANASMELMWAPFHYDINCAVSIGISYRVKIWRFHKTFKVELGASLHLYGPEFAGEITVHWYIISFTIRFGNGGSKPLPINWIQFKSKFLDNPTNWNDCTGRLANHLQSKIPFTSICFGENVLNSKYKNHGVYPMGRDKRLEHRAVIKCYKLDRNGFYKEIQKEQYDLLVINGEFGNIAPALWGTKEISPNRPELISQALIGFDIMIKKNSLEQKDLQNTILYDEQILSEHEVIMHHLASSLRINQITIKKDSKKVIISSKVKDNDNSKKYEVLDMYADYLW